MTAKGNKVDSVVFKAKHASAAASSISYMDSLLAGCCSLTNLAAKPAKVRGRSISTPRVSPAIVPCSFTTASDGEQGHSVLQITGRV